MAITITINVMLFYFSSSSSEAHQVSWEVDTTENFGLWGDRYPVYMPSIIAFAVRCLAGIHSVLAFVMMVGFLSVEGRVYLDELKEKKIGRQNVSIYHGLIEDGDQSSRFAGGPSVLVENTEKTDVSPFRVFQNPFTIAHLMYLVLSLIGTFYNPFILSLELFAIARRIQVFIYFDY